MKHVLVLAEDPMVNALCAENLEAAGFETTQCMDGQSAATIALSKAPDLIVVDAVSRSLDGVGLVTFLRGKPGLDSIPMIVLPDLPPSLVVAIKDVGANRALGQTNEIVSDLLDEIALLLDLRKFLTGSPESKADLLERFLAETEDLTHRIRETVLAISANQVDTAALHELFFLAHALDVRAAFCGLNALSRFGGCIAKLAYEMWHSPELTSPSVVRTLTLAVDSIPQLADRAHVDSIRDLSQARILTVDDDPITQKAISASMEKAGLDVVCVGLPSDALARLPSEHFDLIFLDVGLPEMLGFELCSRIRELSAYEKTPIVFITGVATFQSRVQSNLSGGNDFIGKPFHFIELPLKAMVWLLRSQIGKI
jgi:DNA-binding response OmpR family regulator